MIATIIIMNLWRIAVDHGQLFMIAYNHGSGLTISSPVVTRIGIAVMPGYSWSVIPLPLVIAVSIKSSDPGTAQLSWECNLDTKVSQRSFILENDQTLGEINQQNLIDETAALFLLVPTSRWLLVNKKWNSLGRYPIYVHITTVPAMDQRSAGCIWLYHCCWIVLWHYRFLVQSDGSSMCWETNQRGHIPERPPSLHLIFVTSLYIYY